MLCQHNILRHSFLDAFCRHKELLSVDPASQRGPLPPALARGLPDVKQHIDTYAMLVELRYMDDSVISPPLRITAVIDNYPCLTSALERGQKIKIPFKRDFNPAHFFFAVTIVRRRDGKCECKRIFQFPSPSESFFDFGDNTLLFCCPTASDLEHPAGSMYHLVDPFFRCFFRCPCGLQVLLGTATGTNAYEAERVEIYSYSDNGEQPEDVIGETLQRIEYIGRWS